MDSRSPSPEWSTFSLSSLSSVPAESSGPQNASSRRRRNLQDADAESFFDWLGGRNISCSALLRALFDPAQSSFSKDTLRQVRSRVNPFFGTIAAKSFIDNCPSAQESAVNYILRQVRKEASKASALPEISRPQGRSRAEDIRTFRLKSAVDILESNLPITFAVTQAIAGVGKDDDAPVENTSTAVEEAMSTLAPLASTADDEEALNEGASDSEPQPLDDSGSDLAAAEEDELRNVWEDVGEDIRDDVEEGQPATADGNGGTEAEPKETAPVSRRRKGKRNPKIVAAANTLCLLMGRNNRNGRFGLNLGLFLFASRTGRRTIDALGRMGLSASYLTIHRAVKALSRSARRQLIAKIKDPFSVLALGYDNINWLQRARNKGLTVTNTMRAAVHGVVYEVDASVQLQEGPQHSVCNPLVVDVIFESDMPKPSTTPTNLADRAHNPDGLWPKIREQRDQMRKQATPDIHPFSLLSSETDDEQFVLSVVSHARKAFLAQHQYLDYDHPFPEPPQIWPLTPRKTVVHTLPVLDVDEGSVEGNIEVFKQYLDKHVKVPNSFWRDRVLSIIADAFTTEKIKQAQRTRNLDRSPDSFDKFDAQQPWAAPWHLMYAYIRCLFLNHGGAKDQPSAISFRHLSERVGFRNLPTQPYNFHDSSRFLHFWFAAACNSVIEEAVRKHLDPLSTASSADKPADNPADAAKPARGTAERRARHSGGDNDAEHPAEEFKGRLDHETFLRISNAAIHDLIKYGAQDLLGEQEEDGKKRDDIALHSRTMFADVALFIELQAAIKVGDTGRLIIAMKMLVPRFQSTGQHNYVSELLEIIVSLRFEMPPALRAIMVASLFVNTDGGQNTFMPTDLLQENFVFDLKHTWPVGGTTKSLEYKQVIGSPLQVLAGMKMGLWEDLGIASQSQNHSDKKRAITITALQRDFDRLKIFEWDNQGRAGSEFEVMRGDAVRQERSSLQAAGKSTKHIRQSKTMACDAWASGMLQLSGTSTGSGSYDRWKARRALSLGKEGAAATHADADQPVLEGAAAEEGFAYIGLSSSTAGFEELEDDVC